MNKMYLIQRGKFNPEKEFAGLTGRNGLIDLDYMGSAEFEFGAIPYAYRRIMGYFDNYSLFDTGMKTVKGVPFKIFCKTYNQKEILTMIQSYIENPYHLKEYSALEFHFKDSAVFMSRRANTNFWWDIKHDWIAFIGAADRDKLFISCIEKDYNEWWLKKSKEDREEELKLSFK